MKNELYELKMACEEEFYGICSDILSIDHEYKLPFRRKTRWNARVLGNGRFPGFGLIQDFGPHVRVMCKKGTFIFITYEEVYEFLRNNK